MNLRIAILGLSACLLGPVFAQGGDDCSAPSTFGAPGSVAFETSSATTSGFNGGGGCVAEASTINQDRFWIFTAPSDGDFQFDTEGSNFDTMLSVHLGDDCSATCIGHNDDAGVPRWSRVQLIGVTAGTVFLVQVGGWGTFSGDAVLNIAEYVDPCSAAIDDAFEDNDSCGAPQTITAGTYADLFVGLADPDYYAITLQPEEFLRVTITGEPGLLLLKGLYDMGCNQLQRGGTASFAWDNAGGSAPLTVIVEVVLNPNTLQDCGTYAMEVAITPDPCLTLPTDVFEDNDDCASAIPLGDGVYPDLTVSEDDNDFFAVGVDAGDTIFIFIPYLDAFASLDLFLWDPTIACDTNVVGTGGAYLARSLPQTNNRQIVYTNTTQVTQDLIIEVDMASVGRCNTYELQLSGTNGMVSDPGQGFCSSGVNSTGTVSTISATGSVFAANNDLVLIASDLPPSAFGFFIASQTKGFAMNPAGSAGNLCLGGAIGRFVGPGQIMSSDVLGTIELRIDLNAVPQPTGPVPVSAGEEWNFQLWHRDSTPAGPTSNFTPGLEVVFL